MPSIELPAQYVVSMLVILVVLHLMLLATAYLIFMERKVCAWIQDRIGPNRTGLSFGQDNLWRSLKLDFMNTFHFWGLGQALADGIKLMFKEDYTPPRVDKTLFRLAPVLVVIPALIGWAVIPWGGLYYFPGFELGPVKALAGWTSVTVAPVNIGVIYLLAIGSLAVYGVTLGAYASNNKYSFLGGLRATAQMLSYEIPMGLIVLIMLLTYMTPDAGAIVNLQGGGGGDGAWGIFMHPLLAVIFFVCILAEANRAPFDLAEAEQELVGGFHTEYASMKWALFFLGEYIHMITGSAFFAILFLGGWDIIPFVADLPVILGQDAPWWAAAGLVVLKFLVFAFKIFLLIFVMMWVRWTLPRLRFDQLMKLAWRGLVPMMLVAMLIVGLLVWLDGVMSRGEGDGLPLGIGVWFLAANIVVTLGAMFIGPMLPKGPPVNRRIGLDGSRFSPPVNPDAEPTPA